MFTCCLKIVSSRTLTDQPQFKPLFCKVQETKGRRTPDSRIMLFSVLKRNHLKSYPHGTKIKQDIKKNKRATLKPDFFCRLECSPTSLHKEEGRYVLFLTLICG